jgi:hypothetical protein
METKTYKEQLTENLRHYWGDSSEAERIAWVERARITPDILNNAVGLENVSREVIEASEGTQIFFDIFRKIEQDIIKYTRVLFPKLTLSEDYDFASYLEIARNHQPLMDFLISSKIGQAAENSETGSSEVAAIPKYPKRIPAVNFVGSDPYMYLIRDILRDEVLRREQKKKSRLEKKKLKPLTNNDGFLRGVADPINQHMFEALTPGAMQKSSERKTETNKLEARGITGLGDYTSVYIVESNKKDIYGVIGYKNDVGEALWAFQQEHSALALQVHIALFARAYAETDANPGEFITLRISDFCDDLQFTKKNGSHRRETKQRVLNILNCLTRAEMKITYAPPNGKQHFFTGPIWQRGITHETVEPNADVWQKDPESFSYAPGQYFSFDDWRYYTRNVALIGEGLLKLDARKDKWAIHIGGYLALLGRMNGYKKQPLDVRGVLEKTGLLATYGKLRQVSEMEDKLERGLSTLEEFGVIQKWDWAKTERSADSKTLVKLTTDALFKRQIIIEYPELLKRNEKQITDGKEKHLRDNQKKIRS